MQPRLVRGPSGNVNAGRAQGEVGFPINEFVLHSVPRELILDGVGPSLGLERETTSCGDWDGDVGMGMEMGMEMSG